MVLEGLAWVATAAIGVLAISQLARATWHPLWYVLQAFTVHAAVFSLVVSIAAFALGRPLLALLNAVLVIALSVVIVPLVRSNGRARSTTSSASARSVLTVLHANIYYDNDRIEPAADVIAAEVAEHDVDVIVIAEYSLRFEDALSTRLVERYPFTAGGATNDRDGLGLLSRLPVDHVVFAPYRWEPGVELGVAGVRLVVVHPGTGLARDDLRMWKEDLEYIGDRATTPGPATLVVGDFNVSRWHPPFRDLLDRGFVDVHERLGRGFSTSWPVDWWRPRFVRLDHALADSRLTPLAVSDFRVPGSDHTGFVVKVAISPS